MQTRKRAIDGISYPSQYEYNAIGQMTAMTYPSGKKVNVGRDDRGRLSALQRVDVSGAPAYLSGINYRADGLISSQKLGDGAIESFGYSNDRLQLTSQTVTNGSATLLSLSYGYQAGAGQMGSTGSGNSGQLVSVSGTINGQDRSQAFTYDNVGRLVGATGWGAWARRFDYDRYGNRTAVWNAVSGGNQLQTTVIQQDALGIATNRIASVNGTGFSYDASGNVTGDGASSYTYDAVGRIVNVSTVSGGESYGYDAGNHRVKKVAGGVVTHYMWEGDQVIAEYERGGANTPGTGTRYYHQDRLSTSVITDGAGAVVGSTDHLPFGEEIGFTGESEKHKFTSYERDNSGLDYAVNRHYNSAIGRFMQPDPMGGGLTNPQSLNRYTYVTNDPINKVDPLGLYSIEDFIDEEDGGGGWYVEGGSNGPIDNGNVRWVNSGEAVPDGYVPYTNDTVISYDGTQEYHIDPNGPDPTAEKGSDAALGILWREDISIKIDSSEQELTDLAKGALCTTGRELAAVDPYLNVMAMAVLMGFGGPVEGGGAIIELGIGGAEVATAAEGTLTFYRGTTAYDALETVQNGAFDASRLAEKQATASYSPGLYLTSQEETANFYAELAGVQGRGGGPGMLKVTVPKSEFRALMQKYNIQLETPVARLPGQTETRIPPEALNEFNAIMNVSEH